MTTEQSCQSVSTLMTDYTSITGIIGAATVIVAVFVLLFFGLAAWIFIDSVVNVVRKAQAANTPDTENNK
jgi:hypothetical protein